MKALIPIAIAAVVVAVPLHANFLPSDAFVFVDAEQHVAPDDAAYERGSDLLDEHEWRRALEEFKAVERMHSVHAAAAVYWQAYAYNKLAMRADALARLAELRKSYPHSRWQEDAEALEVEIRHSLGEVVRPDQISDDDVKIIAINGWVMRDPQRALPVLDGIIRGNKPVKVKQRALFVVAQSGSPGAQQILVRVAEDDGAPDLQETAVKYLGLFGGDANRKVLTEVYNATKDLDVKRSVLRSYMLSGDRTRLLALAKGEKNDELRGDAVLGLGLAHATKELGDLYAAEHSTEMRQHILQAMFVSGGSDKIGEIARNETNAHLKSVAIRDLGLLGGARSAQLLVSCYDSDMRRDVRRQVIDALAIQQNAAALRDLISREKDEAMKREIEARLAVMSH